MKRRNGILTRMTLLGSSETASEMTWHTLFLTGWAVSTLMSFAALLLGLINNWQLIQSRRQQIDIELLDLPSDNHTLTFRLVNHAHRPIAVRQLRLMGKRRWLGWALLANEFQVAGKEGSCPLTIEAEHLIDKVEFEDEYILAAAGYQLLRVELTTATGKVFTSEKVRASPANSVN